MVVRDALALRSLLPLLCIASAALAQNDAPWSFVQTIEIDGNKTFTTATIRSELAANARVADALLRARDDDERADAIADCTADGYRRAGFVDVAVRAARKDGRVLLTIVEGPRCRVGAVRVVDNEEVAANDIAAAMRAAEGPWAGWHGDGWADCSSVALARARQRIVSAYADTGRWDIRAIVEHVRTGERVDLVGTVLLEGQVVRVGRIRLAGERAGDVEAVLQRIQPPEDAPLTAPLIRSLRTQLMDLGRYIAVGTPIDGARPERTSRSPQFDVEVASFAPAMKDMPWDDLARLRAGLATIRAHLDGGKALRIVVPLTAEAGWLGFTVLPGPLVVVLGQEGGGIRCERVRLPDGSIGAVDAIVTATHTLVALGDGGCGVTRYTGARASLSATLDTKADGSFELRWGFGVHQGADAGPAVVTWTHPATALRLLQRGFATRDGDDVVIAVPGGQLRIDRAGSVRSAAENGSVTSELLPLTLAEHFDATLRRYDAARVQPLGAYLLQFGAANAATLTAATTPAQRDALACLRSFADWWSTHPLQEQASPDDEFSVPGASGWPGLAGVTAPLLYAVAQRTPQSSWLATLVAPMRALMLRTGSGVRAVNAVAVADTSGPFATAAAAALLDSAGYDAVAKRCWQRAVDKCTADAAIADLRALVPADAPPAWVADLAAYLRRDDKTAAIFADLPADAKPADVLARAFRRCWDAGFGERVRHALLERDD